MSYFPEAQIGNFKIWIGGISLRSMIRYSLDLTVAPGIIDTYITQPIQTTHSRVRDATNPQQEPWWSVLGFMLVEFPPGQIPEMGSRVTAASGGNFSEGLQTFAGDQIRENGTGPVRVRKNKFSPVSITLIQSANQGPRQCFATHQRSYS
jgi:hypothetical protein